MLSHYKALSLCAAVTATALGLAAIAAPVSAKAKQEGVVVIGPRLLPTRAVDYRDLDLATLRDRNLLVGRIDRAVGEVCEAMIDTLAQADRDSACRTATWQSARFQMARAIDSASSSGRAHNASAVVASVINVSPVG